MKSNNRWVGTLYIVISLVFGLNTLNNLSIGSLSSPGPGFFPLLASACLMLLGLLSLLKSYNNEFVEKIQIKNIIIVVTSIIGFGIFTHYVNLVIGTAVLIAIALTATPENYIKRWCFLFLFLIAVAAAFKYFLGLNLPLWR